MAKIVIAGLYILIRSILFHIKTSNSLFSARGWKMMILKNRIDSQNDINGDMLHGNQLMTNPSYSTPTSRPF